jgi:hypothetical protein
VPKNARRVLEHAHKGRHIDLVALNRRPTLALLGRVQLAEVGKAGKAPVALFVDEAVVGICCRRESG